MTPKNPLLTAVTLSLVALTASAAPQGKFKPKGIYGADDRRELSQVQSPTVKAWADATVAIFQAGSVTADAEKKTSALTTKPFDKAGVRTPEQPWGTAVDLCPDEPYKGQGAGAFCSGSLVGPDLVMTAGHCMETEEECKAAKFVFGFAAGKDGQPSASVSTDEVYSCGKLVAQKLEGNGPDYAIVKLDREVTNHKPLRLRRSGNPPNGTPLVVIGHPVGLPTKVAGGASIRQDDKGGYLVSNLDTYGGNSGSAVLNAVTGEVEGILVRGGADFEYDAERKCARSVKTMNDTGRGEDVTLVSNVASFVPDANKPKSIANAQPSDKALKVLALLETGVGPF